MFARDTENEYIIGIWNVYKWYSKFILKLKKIKIGYWYTIVILFKQIDFKFKKKKHWIMQL